MEQPYERLAQAIVAQAARDYVSATRTLRKHKDGSNRALAAEKMLNETDRFFHSPWFKTLCDLDGDKILRMLRKETGYDS